MEILDTKLRVGCATIIVLYNRVADINRISSLYMIKIISHIESYRRDMMVRVRLLNEFKLEVTTLGTYLATHSVVIDIVCTEYRRRVSRSERLELLEDTKELRSDLREIKHCVDIYHWGFHLRNDCS